MITSIQNIIDAWRAGRDYLTCARLIGVGIGTLHGWATGKSLPTNLAIPALAKALGIPESDLRAQIATERAARAAAKATP
jgi:transcriptional regulator with XRE-family HTH domain